jgi:hypothetical protein
MKVHDVGLLDLEYLFEADKSDWIRSVVDPRERRRVLYDDAVDAVTIKDALVLTQARSHDYRINTAPSQRVGQVLDVHFRAADGIGVPRIREMDNLHSRQPGTMALMKLRHRR